MKVVFLVEGDERKRAVAECAEVVKDELALKVSPYGEELYVIEANAMVDDIEGAKFLSEFLASVEKKLGRKKKGPRPIRILADDASALFCHRLYPMLCEFEVRLRAALCIAMCASKDSFNDVFVASLENTTLEQLERQLLESQFASQALSLVKGGNLSKSDLLSQMETLEEGPLWERLFGVGDLASVRKNFSQIRMARNNVMHFRTMGFKTYVAAFNVIEEANKELRDYVAGALSDESFPDSRKAAAEATSRLLARSYAAMIDAVGNANLPYGHFGGDTAQIQGIASALRRYSEVGKAAREPMDKALASYDFSGLVSALSQVDYGKFTGALSAASGSLGPACEGLTRKAAATAVASTKAVLGDGGTLADGGYAKLDQETIDASASGDGE